MRQIKSCVQVELMATPDFDKWKDRLHCVGIDFRDLASVSCCCKNFS